MAALVLEGSVVVVARGVLNQDPSAGVTENHLLRTNFFIDR